MPASPPLRSALRKLQLRLPQLRQVQGVGASLEIALARIERPESRPARLIEGARFAAHAVSVDGPAVVSAFLDGVQESHEVAWLGTVPLIHGRVAAVVRSRVEQRLVTWRDEVRQQQAIYAPWRRLPAHDREVLLECGFETRDVAPGDEGAGDVHPLRVMQDAANAVTQDREALERDLARDFCSSEEGTLYLDGGLPSHDVVHASPRVVGVVKSHQTLYVSESDLPVVFGLRMGERSSVLVVESRRRLPVATWYLRLRDAMGHDPFWGLVRVEVPLGHYTAGGSTYADERSAWVVAERAPVALPDGRWDTMAYGIRNCESYLRAALGR